MIRKVHVVFKTHLDIGFTDLADAVIHHYLKSFIPSAIRAAEELNPSSGPPRFVWTVGSYLIDLALRELDAGSAERLDAAVRKGYISYHALPFTTHSELCSPKLFQSGLNITRRLDERYGRHTISAKMSDVPGHSAGILPPLAKQGVRFLHLGINAVARMPRVPALFMWENTAGQRVMVNYTRSYGGLTRIPGHDEALYFMHTNDNAGPPSLEAINRCFDSLTREFPAAEVLASTLDAFAKGLLTLEGSLPIVKGEIGDTWIHGIGTDPRKTAMLRALDRLADAWDTEGLWQSIPAKDGRSLRDAFLEQLLLVCEHTWGLDTKKFLNDFIHWNRDAFEAARREDVLRDAWGLGAGYDSSFYFARREFERLTPRKLSWEDRRYSLFESSHREQRDYIAKALELLPVGMRKQADQALTDETPAALKPDEPEALCALLGAYSLRYENGKIIVSWEEAELLRLCLPLYQEVGLEAFDRLRGHYLTDMEKNKAWAIPDNSKPGAENSDAPYKDRPHRPRLDRAALTEGAWQLEGHFNDKPVRKAGCPKGFRLRFEPRGSGLRATLLLYGKAANRKPEALYLPMHIKESGDLRLNKIGDRIDPDTCLPGGNRRTHGIQALDFRKDGCLVHVIPLDTPLVCLWGPKLLDFDGEAGNGRVYFNLYNNLWGTNFKMWYEEEILCRFLIEAGPPA